LALHICKEILLSHFTVSFISFLLSVSAGLRGGLMNRPAAPPQAAFQQTQPATPQAFVTQQYPAATPTGGQEYGRLPLHRMYNDW